MDKENENEIMSEDKDTLSEILEQVAEENAEEAEAETAETAEKTAFSSGAPAHAKKKEDDGKPHGFLNGLFDILEMFAVCTAVILLVFTFVIRLTVVEGPSMENTLVQGDYLFVQTLGYEPHRGDIVVVQEQDADINKPLIKRVIAVGGDEVTFDENTWTVYVNGTALDEPYTKIDFASQDDGNGNKIYSVPLRTDFDQPIKVEEGKIFVMGDHRSNSSDSRSSHVGQIDERSVIGRAVFRVFPFSKISTLPRAEWAESMD